jgi:hypothetical protein
MQAWRILSVPVGLIVGLLGGALLVIGIKTLSGPICLDADPGQDCYDGTAGAQVVSGIIGIPAGLCGVATLIAAIYFVCTGRGNKVLLFVLAAAVALSASLAAFNHL